MAQIFNLSCSRLALLANDDRLTGLDMRTMMNIISLQEGGIYRGGQEYLAQVMGSDIANIRKCTVRLEKFQYLVRQMGPRGRVDAILISPFFVFGGRVNQRERMEDLTTREIINRNRKHYYDKLAKDPNDYPNAGRAVWPGYGPNGGDWVYEEKEASLDGTEPKTPPV